MVVITDSWEDRLLSLAFEARHSRRQVGLPAETTAAQLARAYEACTAVTAKHSKSFHLASGLLPPDKRRAARALYAFCRISDDIVDEAKSEDDRALLRWSARALQEQPIVTDLISLAWADTRYRFHIPVRYAEQLIEGVARDLTQTRYQTFTDLTTYAYGVASTVGLMSMHIIGYAGPEAIAYAIKLGVALQLTNILRDVAEDWQNGRVYLPQEELAAFGLSEADIAAGIVTGRWREFMRFQIKRTRRLYTEAWPGIGLLHPDGRLAIVAAARFYQGILDDIEQHDYDVFSRRAYLSKWGKIKILPGLWWKSRQFGRNHNQEWHHHQPAVMHKTALMQGDQ